MMKQPALDASPAKLGMRRSTFSGRPRSPQCVPASALACTSAGGRISGVIHQWASHTPSALLGTNANALQAEGGEVVRWLYSIVRIRKSLHEFGELQSLGRHGLGLRHAQVHVVHLRSRRELAKE